MIKKFINGEYGDWVYLLWFAVMAICTVFGNVLVNH